MPSFGRHGRNRRLALIAGGVAAVIVVIVAFAVVWNLTAPGRVRSSATPEIEGAQPTTESAEPSESAIEAIPATASAVATPSAGTTSPATGPTSTVPSRIAYRLGSNIYVADEDGKNAIAIALAPTGDYALSPDGRTVAIVDGDTKQLVFLDIASRTLVESLIASGGKPVWMPDSSGVLVAVTDATGATKVERVSRLGGSPAVIHSGGIAAVSPDAGTMVVGPGPASSEQESMQVLVIRGGVTTKIKAAGIITAVAAANDRVYFATMGADGAGLWAAPAGGGTARPVLPVAAGSPYGALLLSPDSATLACSVTGDDGYSRVSAVPARGGTPTKLWLRRDDYILQWSADSQWVYLIEGNAFQGESTSLYRVGRDGKGRRLIVPGASL